MMLKILLPAEVMMTQEVKKIVAEAENGSFCLMPNHIDFVATLSPGIFTYEPTRRRAGITGNGCGHAGEKRLQTFLFPRATPCGRRIWEN